MHWLDSDSVFFKTLRHTKTIKKSVSGVLLIHPHNKKTWRKNRGLLTRRLLALASLTDQAKHLGGTKQNLHSIIHQFRNRTAKRRNNLSKYF